MTVALEPQNDPFIAVDADVSAVLAGAGALLCAKSLDQCSRAEEALWQARATDLSIALNDGFEALLVPADIRLSPGARILCERAAQALLKLSRAMACIGPSDRHAIARALYSLRQQVRPKIDAAAAALRDACLSALRRREAALALEVEALKMRLEARAALAPKAHLRAIPLAPVAAVPLADETERACQEEKQSRGRFIASAL
ncbi:MAG: hypothetical protein AAF841_06370 [Pseudomonadota bacterium]